MPRSARKKSAAPSAPPRPIHTRAATSATPAASAISAGWRTARNCGTPKSNSAWNVERPISRPPISETWRSIADRLRRRRAARARAQALLEQHGLADQRHPGPADQHQVRRAPQRDVLAEQPVPHVVEREARERERAAGRHQQAADGRAPAPADGDRGRARGLARHRHREHAGGEHAEQPGEDQVVGGVRERAGVAALVDVQGDVPVHAEQRRLERDPGTARSAPRPSRAGPETRSA